MRRDPALCRHWTRRTWAWKRPDVNLCRSSDVRGVGDPFDVRREDAVILDRRCYQKGIRLSTFGERENPQVLLGSDLILIRNVGQEAAIGRNISRKLDIRCSDTKFRRRRAIDGYFVNVERRLCITGKKNFRAVGGDDGKKFRRGAKRQTGGGFA